jgi:hypothetical protein
MDFGSVMTNDRPFSVCVHLFCAYMYLEYMVFGLRNEFIVLSLFIIFLFGS